MTQVWENSQHKNAQLLMMLALADHANESGICYPGFNKLAQKTRVKPRQAKRVIKDLEKSGEVYINHGGGRHQTNKYFITLGKTADKIKTILVREFELNLTEAEIISAEIINKLSQNSVIDDTLSETQNGVIEGQNSVTDDTLLMEGNGVIEGTNGVIQGQKGVIQGTETVSSMTPEPSCKPSIEPSDNQQQQTGVDVENKNDDLGFAKPDPKLVKVSKLYENEIGSISPMIRDSLIEMIDDYPMDWITDAFETAARQNKRMLSYVEGILRNRQSGTSKPHLNGANKNGNHQTGITGLQTTSGPVQRFNPNTGETYYADRITGERVPAPSG